MIVPLQALTLLEEHDTTAVDELEQAAHAVAPSLPPLRTLLRRGLMAGPGDADEAHDDRLGEWAVWADVTRRALAIANTRGLATLSRLRQRVDGIDKLRLFADILAAIGALIAASTLLSPFGSQISAAIAAVSAVVAAVLPRLVRSDAGGNKPWAEHYRELMDVLADADGVHRRLTIWLKVKDGGGTPSDPTEDIQKAEEICGKLIRKQLLWPVQADSATRDSDTPNQPTATPEPT